MIIEQPKKTLERIAKSGLSKDELQTTLERQKTVERVQLLTARALGFSDLGLDPNRIYDWNFLVKLGITPELYAHVFYSLMDFEGNINQTLRRSIDSYASK